MKCSLLRIHLMSLCSTKSILFVRSWDLRTQCIQITFAVNQCRPLCGQAKEGSSSPTSVTLIIFFPVTGQAPGDRSSWENLFANRESGSRNDPLDPRKFEDRVFLHPDSRSSDSSLTISEIWLNFWRLENLVLACWFWPFWVRSQNPSSEIPYILVKFDAYFLLIFHEFHSSRNFSSSSFPSFARPCLLAFEHSSSPSIQEWCLLFSFLSFFPAIFNFLSCASSL